MNIVIFSGGTGSIALQNGLKEIMPNCSITNIINAYDDGKSTGVCREICHILGPSDIRKNHETQYLNAHKNDANKNILEFYSKRYDIPFENEEKFCLDKLNKWSLSCFTDFVKTFFECKRNSVYNSIELKDFSISNIVYAGAFKQLNYDTAIRMMCRKFNITDNIILNVTDDVLLKAYTNKGKVLEKEVDIVNFGHSYDDEHITDVFFTDRQGNIIEPNTNITDMQNAISEADLIIYSAGTQWASLIPTYTSTGLKTILENSNAKKIFIMNLTNDNDMIGWSGTQIIDTVSKYIPIDFIIKSDSLVSQSIDLFDINKFEIETIIADVKSNKINLHDPYKLAQNVFVIYFNLIKDKPDILFFDFDDTLWSRNSELLITSRNNIVKLNELAKFIPVVITSGNSYESLREKISTVSGADININFDIWADNAAIKYQNNVDVIKTESCKIDNKTIKTLDEIIKPIANEWLFNIEYRGPDNFKTVISLKPIRDNKVRNLIVKYLELAMINNGLHDIIIKATGYTTIDIYNKACSKLVPYQYYIKNKNIKNTFYIGDECDSGNDFEIANVCKNYYQVNDIEETSAIISIMYNMLSDKRSV